jgi:hypothetical protein
VAAAVSCGSAISTLYYTERNAIIKQYVFNGHIGGPLHNAIYEQLLLLLLLNVRVLDGPGNSRLLDVDRFSFLLFFNFLFFYNILFLLFYHGAAHMGILY